MSLVKAIVKLVPNDRWDSECSGDDICSVPKIRFDQTIAKNVGNGVVNYLLPIPGRYGNARDFSGV